MADFTGGVQDLLGIISDEDRPQSRFSLVNMKNCSLISSCVFQAVEKEMDVLDWGLVQMRRVLDLEQEILGGDDSEGSGEGVDNVLTNAESVVLDRYLGIVHVLSISTDTHIAGVTSEAMLKTITNWWKCLTNLVKYVRSSFVFVLFFFSSWAGNLFFNKTNNRNLRKRERSPRPFTS